MLNADAIVGNRGELLSHNVFAYCKNNPINYCDPSGFSCIYVMDDAGNYSNGWDGDSHHGSSPTPVATQETNEYRISLAKSEMVGKPKKHSVALIDDGFDLNQVYIITAYAKKDGLGGEAGVALAEEYTDYNGWTAELSAGKAKAQAKAGFEASSDGGAGFQVGAEANAVSGGIGKQFKLWRLNITLGAEFKLFGIGGGLGGKYTPGKGFEANLSGSFIVGGGLKIGVGWD